MNASIRTTTAPTIIKAGVKDNVLPAKAEAIVNFRIFPGDDLRSVFEMVQERIGDDRVQVEPLEGDVLAGDTGWDPSPVADTESPYFEELTQLIKAAFPGALTAPYLVSGATDARHYAPLTDNAFRFCPVILSNDDLHGMHGVNERLSVENCEKMVGFYIAYIQELANLPGDFLVQDQEEDEEEDLDEYLEDIPEELRKEIAEETLEEIDEDLSEAL
jgi:carboxypeptidase PM20D1